MEEKRFVQLGRSQIDLTKIVRDPRGIWDLLTEVLEKEDYEKYYMLIKKNSPPSGAVLLADNLISHAEELVGFIKLINNDSNVYSSILSIGKGLAFVRWK